MNESRSQKVWLSWSSGKDSYAALRVLRADHRYDVECSFTVLDAGAGRVPMHAVSTELMLQQVKALGLPNRQLFLGENGQSDAMRTLIKEARDRGVRCFAFGDLFLDEIRESREHNMADTGIETLFPLWQVPTESFIADLINGGMRAIITSVDLSVLPESFLGRELSIELVEEMVGRRCDPCGENGEYHSFVFDGPSFGEPVCFTRGERVVADGFGHLPLF